MAIEILDFPINSMVIFHCYVSSPEATSNFFGSAVPSSLIFFWMWFYIYVEKHDDSTRFQSQGPPKKTIQVLGHFSWGNQWCHIKPQASWPYEIATKRPDFQICDAVYGSHMHFFFKGEILPKKTEIRCWKISGGWALLAKMIPGILISLIKSPPVTV